MRKVGLVIDSAFDLLDDVKAGLNLEVAKMNIIVDGVSYVDGTEISLTEILDAVDAGKKVSTSQPSPQEFVDAYEKLKKQGCTDVLVMTVSTVLSGSYQSAQIAKELVDGLNMEFVNSKTSAMGGELMIAEVKDMFLNNVELSLIKITLDELVERLEVYLTVDDLSTLVKGGRMSRTQSFIGTLMKIKPILHVDQEGYIKMLSKVRTTKRVISRMIDMISDSLGNIEAPHFRIGHIVAIDVALEIKYRLLERFNKAKVVISNEITPVVAVHLGKGGFGIAWLKNVK